MNDVWVFDIPSTRWIWLAGDPFSCNLNGVYAKQGEFTSSAYPTSRFGTSLVLDVPRSRFYIFGGANSTAIFNDMWSFDIETTMWMWVNGGYVAGVLDKIAACVSQPFPCPRLHASMVIDPARKIVLMHGGQTGTDFTEN